jgi:hypothetical protein
VPLSDDYFGISPLEFSDKYNKENCESVSTYEITWKGKLTTLEVYQVDVKDLRYNHNNGRLKPNLKQYLADKKAENLAELEIDTTSVGWQQTLHGFLCANKDRKEGYEFFKNGNQQPIQHPLVACPDGRVINGNQRLSIFRELNSTDVKNFDHLSHAYIAILPESDNSTEEVKLENQFQAKELGTTDFDWVQIGLRDLEHLNQMKKPDYKTIGLMLGGRSADEVQKLQRKVYFAAQFLISIQQKDMWGWLRDQNLDQAIETGTTIVEGFKTKEEKNTFCKIVFPVMANPSSMKKKGISLHLWMGEVKKMMKDGVIKVETPKPKGKAKGKAAALKKKKKSKFAPGAVEISIDPSESVQQVLNLKKEVAAAKSAEKDAQHTINVLEKAITGLNLSLENWDVQETKGAKTRISQLSRLLTKVRAKIDEKK